MTTSLPDSPRRALSADGSAAYRVDIDGLRALAILLVVVYHVWLGRVSGGVDVFLMISAFFLTSSFARRATKTGPLHLGRFWLRKFRRLLPAVVVTLLGVLAVAYFWYPQTEWPRIWRETWASLLYVENWALAFSEVDYYARDAVLPSPLQHFWSLSVQGQVFLLWPLIIGLVVLLFRRRRHLVRGALIVVFTAIFAASLAFSIFETASAQSFAYFDTRTRLWEFAAGSLIALLLPWLRLPAWLRGILGWIGVAGIIACGLVLDVQGGFPGYLALWPVVCTALVIVGGVTPTRWGPSVLLTAPPLLAVGRDAYALYLVHWPILITAMLLLGTELDLLQGLGVIALSMLVARIVSRGVENPLRRAAWPDRYWWRGTAVVVVSAALVAAPLGAWEGYETERAAALAADTGGYPGAAVVDADLVFAPGPQPLVPQPAVLDEEWVDLGRACAGELRTSVEELDGACRQSAGAHRASSRVIILGDSHAQQLSSPLLEVAEEQDWGLVSLLKGGCAIGFDETPRSTRGVACEQWRRAAVDYVIDQRPDAVYLIVTRADPGEPERLIAGVDAVVEEILDAGISVIGVRDNPRFSFDMYECVLDSQEEGEDCALPRDELLADENPALELDERVRLVDFTPWLCPEDVCTGTIGNIAVYIDDNHISQTYGRTLAPMLKDMLRDGADLRDSAAVPRTGPPVLTPSWTPVPRETPTPDPSETPEEPADPADEPATEEDGEVGEMDPTLPDDGEEEDAPFRDDDDVTGTQQAGASVGAGGRAG